MTFIVGHHNKCHIYRSVGESEVYIIMLYMFKHFLDKNILYKMTFIVCHSNIPHIYSSTVIASKSIAFNNNIAYIKSFYYNVNPVQAFFLGQSFQT